MLYEFGNLREVDSVKGANLWAALTKVVLVRALLECKPICILRFPINFSGYSPKRSTAFKGSPKIHKGRFNYQDGSEFWEIWFSARPMHIIRCTIYPVT